MDFIYVIIKRQAGDKVVDRKIEFFIITVEAGSFSGAARKLMLSQSAISQQISLLEQERKVMLFDRSGYRPVLTKAGEFYFKKCKELVAFYEQMNYQVKQIDLHSIVIGITGPFESHHIPFIIKIFKEKYPQIEIKIVKGSFQTCKEWLNNNEIDIAFAIESDFINETKIAYQVLFQHQICAICSYEHPWSKLTMIVSQDIIDQPLVCLSKRFGEGFYHDFVEAFDKDRIKPNIIKEVDTLDELILSVKLNEGIGLTSREVVNEEEVAILDIANSHHHANYVIGYSKDTANQFIDDFVTIAKKYFNKTL